MDAMTLLFYLFLQISSLHRGFSLDNCIDLQRHTRLARNDDYIGCYDLGCLNLEHNISFPESIGATPEFCSTLCGDKGFIIAYVYQESRCSCSCNTECLETPVEDYKCGLPCQHDSKHFCGGLNSSAVYKVRSPNISRPNPTEGTKQTGDGDGSDGVPKYYIILASVLVISFIIICALVITVVVIHRRLRKWTLSRNIRLNSRRSSSRHINQRATHRPHAREGRTEHYLQVGAEMFSPTNRGQAPNRATPCHLSNDAQSPAVDNVHVSPYEVLFNQGVDQGARHSPHYSTLERTVVASSFDGNDDEYDRPDLCLNMRKTPADVCGKDGYLVPGSSSKESSPGAYTLLNR